MREYSKDKKWMDCVEDQFTNIRKAFRGNEEGCEIVEKLENYIFTNLESILKENSQKSGKENCHHSENGQRIRINFDGHEDKLCELAIKLKATTKLRINSYLKTLFCHLGFYGFAIHKNRLDNWTSNEKHRKRKIRKK